MFVANLYPFFRNYVYIVYNSIWLEWLISYNWMSYIERMIICKKKLVLLLACLMMVACMVIINSMRGKEKKTEYDFMNKKDKWWLYLFTLTLPYLLLLRYSWDKRYEENRHSVVDDEEEVKKIRNGKYIPPRRVVHLGQTFILWID